MNLVISQSFCFLNLVVVVGLLPLKQNLCLPSVGGAVISQVLGSLCGSAGEALGDPVVSVFCL